MPDTITLFEHKPVPFAWTERDVAALERLRDVIGSGQPILRPTVLRDGTHALTATQFVGVVRLQGHTIEVLPKIYRDASNEDELGPQARHEATRNLLHLLAYAHRLPVREIAPAPLRTQNTDWFEILTRLFATHLRDEWRRGPVRRYVSRDEDRSPTLRGKWRVSDQLRRPAEKHVFAITSDEFSADNPLNRVFRFVVERLWHLTRDHDNRRTLGDLRQTMEADDIVLPAHVSARDSAPALVSRLHQRFAPLLDLARLFLDGGGLQLLSGGARDTFAFVFDMNKLFEQFVFGFLSRHRAEILPAALHDCDLLPQSRGATRHLAQRDNGLPVFRLEPDIAFRKPDGTFPLLLDTKYKRLDPFDRAHGVSQADFYQMFAYAHRYDCPRVLLVYPQTETSGSLSERFMTGNPPRKIAAVTVDLHLDLGSPAGKRSLTNELRDCLTWKESE